MSRILCLTPAGRLRFEESAEQETELAAALVEQLQEAFEKASAEGIGCIFRVFELVGSIHHDLWRRVWSHPGD